LYTAADFKLDERHAIKNKKVALDRLPVRQNVFLVIVISFDPRYFKYIISINTKEKGKAKQKKKSKKA